MHMFNLIQLVLGRVSSLTCRPGPKTRIGCIFEPACLYVFLSIDHMISSIIWPAASCNGSIIESFTSLTYLTLCLLKQELSICRDIGLNPIH